MRVREKAPRHQRRTEGEPVLVAPFEAEAQPACAPVKEMRARREAGDIEAQGAVNRAAGNPSSFAWRCHDLPSSPDVRTRRFRGIGSSFARRARC